MIYPKICQSRRFQVPPLLLGVANTAPAHHAGGQDQQQPRQPAARPSEPSGGRGQAARPAHLGLLGGIDGAGRGLLQFNLGQSTQNDHWEKNPGGDGVGWQQQFQNMEPGQIGTRKFIAQPLVEF